MLKSWSQAEDGLNSAERKELLKQLRQQLEKQQLLLKEAGLPVVVLVEGWGAAGKGDTIQSLIRELDPRYYHVLSMKPPTQEERRWPFLKRYFQCIPPKGKILFLDSGWLDELVRERLCGNLSDREFQRGLESVRVLERQLVSGGYLLIKLFLHVDEQTQRERLDRLSSDRDTAWRVSEDDRRQNRNYERALELFDQGMEETDPAWARWKILDGTSRDRARLEAARWICDQIDGALKERQQPEQPQRLWELLAMPELAQVPLDAAMDEERYQQKLKKLRKKLKRLHNELYRKKIPVVVAFEGWDAAGKGSSIKRLTSALDPRGYEVLPIAAPEPGERERHYLWRFWTRLPKTGHIAIYDRSWYGRVMVERIEGLCTQEDWQRAYDEINEFERELTDYGAVVVKFWLQIDQDTQLSRFEERQNTPEKQWKITEEDWRNRKKWDQYETAVNEMLERTSTNTAPWYIIPAVDKRYARIRTMEIVIKAMERAL